MIAYFHIPFVSTIILEIEVSVLYSGAIPVRILGEFHHWELFQGTEVVL
jgi:hypothetical protein